MKNKLTKAKVAYYKSVIWMVAIALTLATIGLLIIFK